MSNPKSCGLTPSEKYLNYLCERSFLSLWSYSNLHTDEGRKDGKGAGRELCDLLVVFGEDIIIFSIKDVKFNQTIDTQVAWKRWYRKAIHKSSKQLFGAESCLRNDSTHIFVDSHCQHKLPISLPSPDRMRVHRICIALGVYNACKSYFGGNSLGSLVIDSGTQGNSQHSNPFHIGHVNPSRGFVHVFEDFTFNVVLRELDTISDFTAYLSKRNHFLSRDKPAIIAAGEEQLLSIYLTHMNSEGEHDFVLPIKNGEEPDWISLDESFWGRMVKNPQYTAKKKADEISYVWDRLIEHIIKYGGTDFETSQRQQPLSELEQGLRHMASEPRLRRRQLAYALVNLLENTPQGQRATRVVYSNDFPEKAYVFLILPQPKNIQYEKYREFRKTLLIAYCNVTKLRCQNANYIIGVATENIGAKGASEDLAVLDVRNWTPEMRKEAEQIREDASLLLDTNVILREGRIKEYPDISKSK